MNEPSPAIFNARSIAVAMCDAMATIELRIEARVLAGVGDIRDLSRPRNVAGDPAAERQFDFSRRDAGRVTRSEKSADCIEDVDARALCFDDRGRFLDRDGKQRLRQVEQREKRARRTVGRWCLNHSCVTGV